MRGNRIKNIVDELAGERIDIVRWNDDLDILIPNALQPAEVEQVILCKMLGRAIVLVREDQLSLAIGRRGQNVRLASKLSGWDIEIMTQEELAESIDRAVGGFSDLEGVEVSLAEKLVEEGFLSYDDLSIIEPDALMEMGSLEEAAVDAIVEQAEVRAHEAEVAAAEQRRRQREEERLEAERQAEQRRLEQETAQMASSEAATEAAPDSVADGVEPGSPAENPVDSDLLGEPDQEVAAAGADEPGDGSLEPQNGADDSVAPVAADQPPASEADRKSVV